MKGEESKKEMGQQSAKIVPIECDAKCIEQVSTILPVDVWCTILSRVNKRGLRIREYNTHTQVCKGFRRIANLSVTKLDINSIVTVGPHRKCTLLAHIISEEVLKQFINLKSLHISFEGVNIYELHEKITSSEYIGMYLSDKVNDDEKLNELDANFKLGLQTIHEVTHPGYRPLSFGAEMDKCGHIISGMWAMLRTVQKTDTPLTIDKKMERTADIYPFLHKFIIEDTVCFFTSLEELRIHTCFDTHLSFIDRLPMLKSLSLCVSTSQHSGKEMQLLMRGASTHPSLRYFESDIDTWFDSDIDWSIFPKVTSVKLDMRVWFGSMIDENSCNHAMKNIIENLPDIEELRILGLAKQDGRYPFKSLEKLQKLRILDISSVKNIRKVDLDDICDIPCLQTLVVTYSQIKKQVNEMTMLDDNMVWEILDEPKISVCERLINDIMSDKRPDINVVWLR